VLALAAIESGAELICHVVAVRDSYVLATLLSRQQIKARLHQFDALELRHAFGRRSRQTLANMRARQDATASERGKDRYGHTLG
jgi:hypothetical protein